MRIYNSLTRRVETIVPLEAEHIRMYSCGPTVYRFIHVGNLRTFTMADWLRRAFEYRGWTVQHVKNITDVGHMRLEMLDRGEDKLIAQARKEGKTSAQIAQFYTEAFYADEQALNILPAHIFPRATEHVAEMIALIEGLLAKGIAYQGGETIYFDIKRFPEYGKLSGNQLEHMLAGVRGEGREKDVHKRNPEDFALWKTAELGREMAWESPWGRGFPGWHIECSAMAMKYLGSHFDLHTGGVDNLFPHHEDEIAQCEGLTGQPYVNYWVHAQHLLADGQKMSKSTGNTYTRAEIEARGFDPLALRYFYTTALYRSRLNFTFRALRAAQTALERLRGRAYQLLLASDRSRALAVEPLPDTPWRAAFLDAIEDDLNLPKAMALIWHMLRDQQQSATTKLRDLLDSDRILGFGLREYLLSDMPEHTLNPQTYLAAVPASIATQLEIRQTLRQQHAFVQADEQRRQLATAGYALRDTVSGSFILPRRLEEAYPVLSRSNDAPDYTGQPDQYTFSINLLAQNNCADLARCLTSIQRCAQGSALEVVIIDNGSTDETLDYLQDLARDAQVQGAQGEYLAVQVLFADHNMGFAAGRNATLRASRGRYVVFLDTSIELTSAPWAQLTTLLEDPSIGIVGPYGLVTDDLREFREAQGPDVDAVEGYLMAFRRDLWPEFGKLDERFRFYRLLDIHFSFFCKAAGYRVLAMPQLTQHLLKHPHREWFSLNEDERATKSKKNYDIFHKRWHHGQSLLAANYQPQNRWFGHDHAHHLGENHTHAPGDLPPRGTMHTHVHQHWPDHAHEHAHYHISDGAN